MQIFKGNHCPPGKEKNNPLSKPVNKKIVHILRTNCLPEKVPNNPLNKPENKKIKYIS